MSEWQPRIGDEVRVAEHIAQKWPEWRGVSLWVVGVNADRNGRMALVGGLNVTVAEEWPVSPSTPGFTDGFYINRSGDEDDLIPAPAPPSPEAADEIVRNGR